MNVCAEEVTFHKIINKLKISDDPLSLLKKLSGNGLNIAALSHHSEFSSMIIEVVCNHFGMGLKIMMDAGVDLACQHPDTGDSPLLAVCAEGLCGPIRQLISHLPPITLLNANHSATTPLKLLLARAHTECGCLQLLLNRLPLTALLLPKCLVAAKDICAASPIPVDPFESAVLQRENSRHCQYSNFNTAIMPLAVLLERIRSTDPRRILGVVELWMKSNLLLLLVPNSSPQQESNLAAIWARLIEPRVKEWDIDSNEKDQICKRTFEALKHLIILDQLDGRTVWQKLSDRADEALGTEESDLSKRFISAQRATGFPLSLQSLVVRALRVWFQRRFVNHCLDTESLTDAYGALVFADWTCQLPVPSLVKDIILLDTVRFEVHA
ncbi:unnamed protein product [Dicrocoelium dendriticum]|nr:unnamed protein product [Dicrocoelium dendriticum]